MLAQLIRAIALQLCPFSARFSPAPDIEPGAELVPDRDILALLQTLATGRKMA